MPSTAAGTVAIWRDLWLEPSQTFIRDQVLALHRWRPLRVGLQAERTAIARPDLTVVPDWLPRRLMWLLARGRPLEPALLADLRAAQVRLVHAHFGPDSLHALPYAQALGVPLLATFHGYDVTQLPYRADQAAQRYLAGLDRVFDYASNLLAVSDYIAECLLRLGAPPAKVVVRRIGLPLLDLPEPEETGTTFRANARIKADTAARATGKVAFADDSGLVVDALGGEPGIHSARWAGPDKDFRGAMNRIQTLLIERGARAPEQRRAHFIAALCLTWPDGHREEFEGRVDGFVVWPPRGFLGFGYDPLFQPDGHDREEAHDRSRRRARDRHQRQPDAAEDDRLPEIGLEH